jgi:hypothetical protein
MFSAYEIRDLFLFSYSKYTRNDGKTGPQRLMRQER